VRLDIICLELEAFRREVTLSDNPSIVYYSKVGDKEKQVQSTKVKIQDWTLTRDFGNCNIFLISFLSVIILTIGIGYGPALIMVDANAVILALRKDFPVPEIDPVCQHTILS
jgi:hypothetical protein